LPTESGKTSLSTQGAITQQLLRINLSIRMTQSFLRIQFPIPTAICNRIYKRLRWTLWEDSFVKGKFCAKQLPTRSVKYSRLHPKEAKTSNKKGKQLFCLAESIQVRPSGLGWWEEHCFLLRIQSIQRLKFLEITSCLKSSPCSILMVWSMVTTDAH